MTPKATLLLNTLLLSALACGLRAGEFDEFKIKREAVFEFAAPPTLSRDGDRVTIAFETKGFCDVTVCIEDAEGDIVRHLACGVLGEKAPAPFAKGAKKQTLVWDGKDDEGKYIDDKDSHSVRVSLGLKAQFEKALFSSTKKRLASYPPLIAATKEGVLVFEGLGVDYLRLYDHEGEYVRTIYPFPANKLDDVKGLRKETFPQDGKEWPVKGGSTQASLLTSGTSSMALSRYCFGTGVGASALAISGERIALAFMKLNRLALDGSTGGLPLEGPTVGFTWRFGDQEYDIGSTSAAFAPDGKWLYLTGILWKRGTYGGGGHGHHGVVKLAFDGNEPPQLFAGKMSEDAFGSGDGQFKMPTSVACDAAGRVYVGDYLNDRVQVFDASGKFLKAIAAPKPMKVQINPRSQELYVFSWSYIYLPAGLYTNRKDEEYENLRKIKPTLTHFGAFDDPKRLAAWDLPVRPGDGGLFSMGPNASVELDFHTDPPTLWEVGQKMRPNADDLQCWGKSLYDQLGNSSYWAGGAVQLHRLKAGKWQLHRNFGAEAAKEIVRIDPPDHAIQRLYVNPKNRHLYICELRGAAKSFEKLVEIDPESGIVKEVPVPFTAEDICFDPQGMIYLRTDQEVVRYDPRTWREVPWDYGEERRRVSFSGDPSADAISALPIPGVRPMWFHEYGLWVNAKGNLAVSCTNARVDPKERVPGEIQMAFQTANVTPYSPRLYPGRARHQEIHVFNKHGQKLYDDAIPGMAIYDGLVIDANDDLYVMSQTTRFFGTKPYFNRDTGTLVKFAPQKGKVLATTTNQTKRYAPFTPVPLPEDSYPKRPPDVVGGGLDKAWMDGAQWFYGGLGFAARASGGCNCWHARFTQDYFARSFAPETDHYSIAVLDSAGNLILRIGRYGNADSLGAKSLVPLGGDEVGLFYPAYLAADTDRRLFVADIGNYRISSIALGYHKDAKVTLKESAGAKE